MRRCLTVLTSVALVAAAAPVALAHPTSALLPPTGLDATHTSTDNVAFEARLPEHLGTAGGALTSNAQVEHLYVVTDPRGVWTYDVAAPRDPVLLGFLPLPQVGGGPGVALAQEDPSTDGRVMLVDAVDPRTGVQGMQVVDLSDPTAPRVVGTGADTDHTWTCVTGTRDDGSTGCAYAYGRSGHVVDLTDPTAPVTAASWRDATGYGAGFTNAPYAHDLTEVAPGLVLVAGSSVLLLDTSDPLDPVELVRLDQTGPDGQPRFDSLGYHSAEWAVDERGRLDRWLVLGTEIAPANGPGGQDLAGSPDCAGPNSVVETWDTRSVRRALHAYRGMVRGGTDREVAADRAFGRAGFELADTFDASGQGLFLGGRSSAHQLYCAHWMEPAPDFRDGGLLAVAYYDRGTRFVEVDRAGRMREVGWFSGAETYAGSPQWLTTDVVYVHDYRRGLDVVSVAPDPATGVVTGRSTPHLRSLAVADAGVLPAPTPGRDLSPGTLVPLAALLAAAAGALVDARRRTGRVRRPSG